MPRSSLCLGHQDRQAAALSQGLAPPRLRCVKPSAPWEGQPVPQYLSRPHQSQPTRSPQVQALPNTSRQLPQLTNILPSWLLPPSPHPPGPARGGRTAAPCGPGPWESAMPPTAARCAEEAGRVGVWVWVWRGARGEVLSAACTYGAVPWWKGKESTGQALSAGISADVLAGVMASVG